MILDFTTLVSFTGFFIVFSFQTHSSFQQQLFDRSVPSASESVTSSGKVVVGSQAQDSGPAGYPAGRPEVWVDYGNFIGKSKGGIESFTGIPYAEPPVGPMRLRNPIPPRRTYSNFNATGFPPSCPQKWPVTGRKILEKLEIAYAFTKFLTPSGIDFDILVKGQEDCLSLDVRRPAGVKKGSGLPVMVYFYGGAGEFGATNFYSGEALVLASIKQRAPIIYVAMNYRLSAFGSLGGIQVGEERVGNLGLKDQRLALKWVQKYISEFGGDPLKVTIFGESAGAISVSYQLLAFEGNHEGLFRAAIMQSGTATPSTSFLEGGGQQEFDTLVKNAGCGGRTDPLECLREINYDTFLRALSDIQGPIGTEGPAFRWAPRIDGEFVSDTLAGSLSKGKFAKVPIITGCQDDEGTVLTLGLMALFSEDRLREYLRGYFFQNASLADIEQVIRLYPANPTAGSPFDTGYANNLTPVFKRFAALFGDVAFQAPRRKFLEAVQAHIPAWGYLDKGMKGMPILGAFHGADLPYVFGIISDSRRTTDYQSRWIAFANTLNPNVPGLPYWTPYGAARQLLLMNEGSTGLTTDNFRLEQITYLNSRGTALALQPR